MRLNPAFPLPESEILPCKEVVIATILMMTKWYCDSKS